MALVMIFTLVPLSASAASAGSVNDRLQQAQNQLKEGKEKQNKLVSEIDSLNKQIQQIQQEISSADKEIAEKEDEIQEAQKSLNKKFRVKRIGS